MSDIFSPTTTKTTTLPSWFSTAQQNAGTAAAGALAGATPYGQTAAAPAAQQLSTGDNYFTQAIKSLQGVQAGANPYTPTGQLNTSTPLGQLFSAQNARLDQMLPAIAAKEGAAGIGGGGFGSLRGQTATDTARAGALTTLAEQQAKAALDAQTQAVQAGQAIGNIGQQYNTSAVNLANLQEAGGLPAVAKYADIINALAQAAPKTETATADPGTLQTALNAVNAIGTLSSAVPKTISDIGTLLKTGTDWYKSLMGQTITTPATPGVSDAYPTGAI